MGKAIPLKKWIEFEEKFESCIKEEDAEECLKVLAEEIENYLIDDPKDIESILILSKAYEKLHNLQKAIEVVETATAYSSNIKLLLRLIVLHTSNLDFEKALKIIYSLKEEPLPEEVKNFVIAQEIVIYYNLKDIKAMEKVIKEIQKKNKDFKKFLFSYLPRDTASGIIRYYEEYLIGEKLLREKSWLQEAVIRIKERFSPLEVFVVAYSDYEYPEWITPVIFVVLAAPSISENEKLKWQLDKEDEILDSIKDLLKEGTIVKVRGISKCH